MQKNKFKEGNEGFDELLDELETVLRDKSMCRAMRGVEVVGVEENSYTLLYVVLSVLPEKNRFYVVHFGDGLDMGLISFEKFAKDLMRKDRRVVKKDAPPLIENSEP